MAKKNFSTGDYVTPWVVQDMHGQNIKSATHVITKIKGDVCTLELPGQEEFEGNRQWFVDKGDIH